ncbi:MAG: tetratricopeptide repeat protein [Methylococcaceae bacterium]|jgi:tetratricopeptide (TPR) repeat protein
MAAIVSALKKLLVLALVCSLVACGGAEGRKAKYLAEGKKLFEAGDFQKAQLSFKNVLQIDPKNIEARYQMAEASRQLNDLQGAVGQYLAVIGEDPKHVMARLRMGQVYLLVNKADEAEKMAKEVQALDPENVEGMVLMASVLSSKKETDTAMAILGEALKKQPDFLSANLLMASLTAKTGKVDEAIQMLKNISEKNATDPAPLQLLAQLYAEKQDTNKVQETLEALVKIKPEKLEYRVRLALFFTAINKLDNAEEVLRQAIKDLPGDENAKLALIDFLINKRTTETAVAELLPMIEQNPDNYKLRFKLVDLELAQKQADKAEETLKEIVERDQKGPQSLKARNKLAKLYVATKRLDEAKALTKEVIGENPRDADALTLRGEFSLSERKIPEAIGDFRAVLVDQPQNTTVLKLLSAAHLVNSEPLLARENMEKVLEITPKDESARLDLVRLLLETGKQDQAMQQLEALLKLNPNSKLGLEAAFKLQLSQKHWDKAQALAKRVQDTYPEEGLGYFLSGLGFQAENKVEKSLPEFEKALAKQPTAIEPLTQLVKSYLVLKQPEKALAKLNEAVKKEPKNFVANNLTGEVYLSTGKVDEALAAFKKTVSLKPEWPNPYRWIAKIYLSKSNKADAIKTYQEGIEKTKGAIELMNDLAAIYHSDGEGDKVIALFEEAYKLDPKPEIANNLASYLADHGTDAASLERAAKLAEPLAQANNANMLDTVGWIAYKQGNYPKAKEVLLKAIALDPESAVNNYHLGMVYFKENDKTKAVEHLKKSVDKNIGFYGLDTAKETLKTVEN